MKTFETRNQGAAACLLHARGSQSFISVTLEPRRRGESFIFEDEDGQCSQTVEEYMAGQHQIADARDLIECFFAVRNAIKYAYAGDGTWRNEDL